MWRRRPPHPRPPAEPGRLAGGRYDLAGHLHTAYEGERVSVHVNGFEGEERLVLSVPLSVGDTPVPDLHLWDAQLASAPTPGGGARVTWNDAPAGTDASFHLWATQAGPAPGFGGRASWQSEALAGKAFDLPAEVIEDRFAVVDVYIGDADPVFDCEKDLCARWVASPLALPRGTLVPLSRGASCTAAEAGGEAAPLLGRAAGPCSLTDGVIDYFGSFANEWVCGSAMCGSLVEVVVDLGAAVEIHSIVAHGLWTSSAAAARFEMSTNGTDFALVAVANQPSYYGFYDVPLAAPATARYVRVLVEDTAIQGLEELSVF
jgi:hypothetical protein